MEGRSNSEEEVYQVTIFPMENSKEERVYFEISAGNGTPRFYNHWHEVVLEFEIKV